MEFFLSSTLIPDILVQKNYRFAFIIIKIFLNIYGATENMSRYNSNKIILNVYTCDYNKDYCRNLLMRIRICEMYVTV
jgi:hypothetical protein